MALRLSEAQVLNDAIHDPLCGLALREFVRSQYEAHVDLLLRALRQQERDTMKEAALAGKIDAYETMLEELKYFSQRMLKEATV